MNDLRGNRRGILDKKGDGLREARSEQIYLILAALCLAAAGASTIILAPDGYKTTLTLLGWGLILLGLIIAGVVSYRGSGFRIILLPVVIYILAGTSLLFIVHKLEGLAIAVGEFKKVPGFGSYKGTEWHASDMWLTITFPVVFPTLCAYALIMIVYSFAATFVILIRDLAIALLNLLLKTVALVHNMLQRAAEWLLDAIAPIEQWIRRSLEVIFVFLRSLLRNALRWIVEVASALWKAITGFFMAFSAWLFSLISAAGRWVANALVALWREIAHPIVTLLALFRSSVVSAWLWTVGTVLAIWNDITKPIRAFFVWIVSSIMLMWRWGVRLAVVIWNEITQTIIAFLVRVASSISQLWKWAVRLIALLWNWITRPVVVFLAWLWSSIALMWRWSVRVAVTVWNGIARRVLVFPGLVVIVNRPDVAVECQGYGNNLERDHPACQSFPGMVAHLNCLWLAVDHQGRSGLLELHL